MELPNPYRCATHPDREAGWRCQACERALCPECTAEVRSQSQASAWAVCAHCDQLADRLTVTGAPFGVGFRIQQALRMPVGVVSVGLIAVLFICLRGLNRLSLPALEAVLAALMGMAFWFAFFAVVHAAARGTDEMKAVGGVDARQYVFQPALRTLAWSAAWLFPLLLVQSLRGLNAEKWLEDPLAWLWCLGVSAVAPAALALLATGRSVVDALSPGEIRKAVEAVGKDYKPAAGMVVGVGVFSFFLLATAEYGTHHGLRHFAPTFLRTFAIYGQLLTARVVGMLLDVRGYALGYALAPARQVPVMPEATPTGKRREPPKPEPQAPAQRAVELTPEVLQQGEMTPAQRVHLLVTALQENQLDAAVAQYASVPESADGWLSPESHLTLGQAAAARAQYALAVRALKHAAQRAPDGPVAPKACVILARLYAERLGDAQSAAKLYRHVVQHYPGTDAARFAQERLAAP